MIEDRTDLDERERSALHALAGTLRRRFPIQGIWLFGSAVGKRRDEESDIDLLVLTRGPASFADREAIWRVVFEINLEQDTAFSALVVPAEQWESEGFSLLSIHRDVNTSGIRL